jgi:D-glycerate 3-kinase
MHCVIVSIDDFYLVKSARQQLARDVHPLLVTRGVPGTHDLALANATLDALLDPSRETAVKVPVFNKASDEREPRAAWPAAAPGVDLVLLEGWCVGCPPQDPGALREPVNALEHNEDPDGVWRLYVNDALASGYRELFQRLDLLTMLAAPSFDSVYQWREQQERQLAQSLSDRDKAASPSHLLGAQALRRFIQHFERLTRHQLSAVPANADGIIELAPDHRMVAHRGRLFA